MLKLLTDLARTLKNKIMILRFNALMLFALLFCIALACSNDPKVIAASDGDQKDEEKSGIFTTNQAAQTKSDSNQAFTDDLHSVIVNEVLPTTKYVYLNVTEGNDQYWIATMKQAVIVGGKYYFNGGLLKTNFESAEYNRVFEKVYLVSNLVAENHGSKDSNVAEPELKVKEIERVSPDHSKSDDNINSIKIAELVRNSKKYEGKTVQISGECIKINPNIMNRNWIHLKDGTKDDFDLVITSSAFVQVGSVVSMSGTVVLNKDFGAGYRYDLILENGTLVP